MTWPKGQLAGGSWEQLNVKRAWSVCMRMILAAFYAHPWAWNEIGFGGPGLPARLHAPRAAQHPRTLRGAGGNV